MKPIEQEFLPKGVLRGKATLLLKPKDALDMVKRCRELSIRVLGIDGFRLTERTTQPVMDESIALDELGRDLECWTRAEVFLSAHIDTDLFFEVVV